MTFYRTDWRAAPFLVALLALLLASAYPTAVSKAVFLKGATAISLFVAAAILLITVFSHAKISDRTLHFSYLLFYRRTIDISSITEITNRPTYIAARSQFRSLYIIYRGNSDAQNHIALRITVFPETELARLVRDLKHINPDIHLDSYSSRLAYST